MRPLCQAKEDWNSTAAQLRSLWTGGLHGKWTTVCVISACHQVTTVVAHVLIAAEGPVCCLLRRSQWTSPLGALLTIEVPSQFSEHACHAEG